jgi:hypothetical protein
MSVFTTNRSAPFLILLGSDYVISGRVLQTQDPSQEISRPAKQLSVSQEL